MQVWNAFGEEFGTVCVREGASWVEMAEGLVAWLVEAKEGIAVFLGRFLVV